MFKGFVSKWGRVGLFAGIALTSTFAAAGDVSWDGEYRVEADKIWDSQMDHSYGKDKAYILHHFILQPKFVAADGLNIYGRFDILNDSRLGSGNVAGQAFGSGIHNSGTTDPGAGLGNSTDGGNVFSDTQQGDPLLVTEVYATWVNEFGVLVVGRAPLQFGLGMTYSAGTGLFDHYISTRDMIGYKIVLGNFFVMPMIGKTSEGALDSEDDVNDYMLHLQYDNPESLLSAGVFVQLRTAGIAGNDIPMNTSSTTAVPPATAPTNPGPNGDEGVGGLGAKKTGGFKSRSINVFISQKYQTGMSLGVEGGFVSGETGISNAAGSQANISSYGVAAELGYNPTKSRWSVLGKLGMASGDDPSKTDTYSGFTFNRNYDIGLLMFNYPLGQRDFLRTYGIRDTSVSAGGLKGANSGSQLDDEAVSNAIYVSPNVQYKIRDNMSVGGTYVWGMLRADPFTAANNGGTGHQSKNLGSEVDFNYQWKPYERLTWITEVGFMLPGAAWQGIENLSNNFVYGIQTKAAINF